LGVDLRGFRECDRALGELPRATAKNVLRRIARGALEPMAAQASAGAPDRSGRLAFSVSVSERGTRRAEWYHGGPRFLSPGVFESARSHGIVMAVGPAGGVGVLPYAALEEFGSIHNVAHPFMRPTWDAKAEGALEYVKTNLWDEIQRAAARLAARSARSGG
jgi:hypothetical protein